MQWQDEGYLLSRNNFDENSIIIETFTLDHGKCSGIVYGGSSRKQKRNFQIGNKIILNWKSKGENKMGYFNVELAKPISPPFFDDKEKSACILSASSILKILLPERQVNKKIYNSFENLLEGLFYENWISLYIFWELSLIKELGYEIDFANNKNTIVVNSKTLKVPEILLSKKNSEISKKDINEALIFNKNLLLENFIHPNKLKIPISRNLLEKYLFRRS